MVKWVRAGSKTTSSATMSGGRRLSERLTRILALGGIAGPVLFSLIVITAASLRSGYSHVSNLISELGASGTEYAMLMNYAGFVPGGLMLAAFGLALATVLPRHGLTIVAAALVTLFGAGMAASGVVSCDPGCPRGGGSVENGLHDTIAPVSFLCLIVGVVLSGARFRRLPAWRHLRVYSLLTGAVALVLLIVLANSLESRAFTGLWQRLLLVTLFAWCVVVGLEAFRFSESQRSPPDDSPRPRRGCAES